MILTLTTFLDHDAIAMERLVRDKYCCFGTTTYQFFEPLHFNNFQVLPLS